MIKSELIKRIRELNAHMYERDIERVISAVLDEISEALANGNRVELRGFSTFSVKSRDARFARNPRSGEQISVGRRSMAFFKTGKELRNG